MVAWSGTMKAEKAGAEVKAGGKVKEAKTAAEKVMKWAGEWELMKVVVSAMKGTEA